MIPECRCNIFLLGNNLKKKFMKHADLDFFSDKICSLHDWNINANMLFMYRCYSGIDVNLWYMHNNININFN
jgi:hypothetical protein